MNSLVHDSQIDAVQLNPSQLSTHTLRPGNWGPIDVEEKVVALVDVRRAHFYAPSRRRVFAGLPSECYQTGDEHMCGLLQYSLYGTRRAAQNSEEKHAASTLSDLKLTRGIACPCVLQGGDNITIGGGSGTPHQNDL